MQQKYPFFFVNLLCFAAGMMPIPLFGQQTAAGKLLDTEIKQWVEKLGDDSFLVRERAGEHLLRIGFDAFPELRKACSSKDAEVARRAEQIISRFESISLRRENETLQFWVKQYAFESNITEKAGIIWILSGPFYDAPNGEGLQTLLRIVRFDENRFLRAEAAKVIVGLPPVNPLQRKKWYQKTVQELDRNLNSSEEQDSILSLVTAFAKIRCELNEKQKEPKDAGLIQRVRELTEEMSAFRSNPDNSKIQPGNFIDILFYYAQAEIQDSAGLTEERDKTVRAALAVRTEPLGKKHPLLPLNENVNEPFYDHYDTGRILRTRYRLNWAKQQLQLVFENSSLIQRVNAALSLAEMEQFLCNYSDAVKYFEQAENWVNSKEYKDIRSDSNAYKRKIRVGKSLCFAYIAEKENDWRKVREHTDIGLSVDPYEIDLLILSYQVILNDPELEPWYKDGIRSRIDGTVLHIEQEMRRADSREGHKEAAVEACNQVAWLLAGTEGSYTEAKALIDAAVKAEPESPAFLDTLAHVYFLGGEYKKAVQAQEDAVRLAPEAIVFQNELERFRKRLN